LNATWIVYGRNLRLTTNATCQLDHLLLALGKSQSRVIIAWTSGIIIAGTTGIIIALTTGQDPACFVCRNRPAELRRGAQPRATVVTASSIAAVCAPCACRISCARRCDCLVSENPAASKAGAAPAQNRSMLG